MFSAYEKAVLYLFRAVPRTGTGQLLDNTDNVKHGLWVTEAAALACPALAEEDAQKYLWHSFGYDMKAMNRGFYRNFREVQEAADWKWFRNIMKKNWLTYILPRVSSIMLVLVWGMMAII